jgi:hypothetical protein
MKSVRNELRSEHTVCAEEDKGRPCIDTEAMITIGDLYVTYGQTKAVNGLS